MKKVLLIENLARDFYTARVPFALFLKSKGYLVSALVPSDEYVDRIRAKGISVIEYNLNRKNKGLFQIIKLCLIYKKTIKTGNFEVIHSYRFQPNLINAIVNLTSKKKIIIHITGLGIAFSNRSLLFLAYRFISQILYQVQLFAANKVIIQNPDDASDLFLSSLWRKKIVIIKGSGVDVTRFAPNPSSREKIRQSFNITTTDFVFVCITRLIWEKGIRELNEAFLNISKDDPSLKLWIVGWSDNDNPRYVNEEYINLFQENPNISFLGRRDDINELLTAADVFVYPSYYREGIPRSILEALASGLPIITTNMPGCNLTVIKTGLSNGLLIEPRSVKEIEKAVLSIRNETCNTISEMANRSRLLAESEFSEAIIFSRIEEQYHL